MGVSIYSAANQAGTSLMQGTIAIKKEKQRSASAIAYPAPKSNSSSTKKKVNYNYREISNQLLRAKKPQGAASALSRAKSRLGTLKRYAASGQYDKKEMEAAVAHARRMVECAQLKVNNLKKEEMERKKYKQKNHTQQAQKNGEVKRRTANKERELEQKLAMEQMQKVQQEKEARLEIQRRKNNHRQQELSKINEADMKYLKSQMENNHGSDVSVDAGVIVSLSAQAVNLKLSEAQIRMQAQQEESIMSDAMAEGSIAAADTGISDVSSGANITVSLS